MEVLIRAMLLTLSGPYDIGPAKRSTKSYHERSYRTVQAHAVASPLSPLCISKSVSFVVELVPLAVSS